jgi:purine-nucleoside phosphorylase
VFPPVADFELLRDAVDVSKKLGYPAKVASCYSGDLFYDDNGKEKEELVLKYGVPCVDMESAELFTLAAKFGVKALSILSVSDMVFEHVGVGPEEREQAFTKMMEIALEAI